MNVAQDVAIGKGGQSWRERVLSQRDWLQGQIAASLDAQEPVSDVLQQTLEAAIASGEPAQPVDDLRAWLSGIARNKVRQFIARKARDRSLNKKFEEHQQVHPPASPCPFSILVRQERFAMTAEALRRLDADDAHLLCRKYFDQWSYEQIARELGMNRVTLANRLHRARRNLRRILNETWNEL